MVRWFEVADWQTAMRDAEESELLEVLHWLRQQGDSPYAGEMIKAIVQELRRRDHRPFASWGGTQECFRGERGVGLKDGSHLGRCLRLHRTEYKA